MNLSDLGEFGLISRIRKLSRQPHSSPVVGIGDDAAALETASSHLLLATTDLLIEDVHFDLSRTDYYSLGWKSAAVNLSDIAAMGGLPRFCLTALGMPRTTTPRQVLDFYRGFNDLLKQSKTVLVGGDTCASRQGLFISVTVLGQAKRPEIITRAGARPGDLIFVTGALGDSAAGLELLQRGTGRRGAAERSLLRKHLMPEPRIAEGRMLAVSRCASAMIDVSDGLSSDLAHICEESRVGAVVDEKRIPLSPALRSVARNLQKPALDYALSGGEDYELLFTVPARKVRKLQALDLPAIAIGVVTRGRKMLISDREGTTKRLRPQGYDHFSKPKRGKGKPAGR